MWCILEQKDLIGVYQNLNKPEKETIVGIFMIQLWCSVEWDDLHKKSSAFFKERFYIIKLLTTHWWINPH